MSLILYYLQADKLTLDEGEARRIQKKTTKYTILLGNLYKMGRASSMLWCLGEHKTSLVQKGACNSHIDRKALAHKLLMTGYYWPTLMKYIIAFVKKCD